MAKTPTFAQIAQGIRDENDAAAFPRLPWVAGYNPFTWYLVNGMLPALEALIDRDLQTARDNGYVVPDDLQPMDLLRGPQNSPTHPTVTRWLNGIALAAEEDRFND